MERVVAESAAGERLFQVAEGGVGRFATADGRLVAEGRARGERRERLQGDSEAALELPEGRRSVIDVFRSSRVTADDRR